MQMLLKNITSEVKTHNRETTVSILFVESKKIFWVQFDCENYTSISKIKGSIYDCVITGCRCQYDQNYIDGTLVRILMFYHDIFIQVQQ